MTNPARFSTGLVLPFTHKRIPWLPDVFLSQSDGIGEEKPLVQAFDNLTSMHRLIDIEKTSNLMRDITYQSASLVPTVL